MNFLFTKTPLLFFVQSFWRDEAFSYVLAKRHLLDIVRLTAGDFNPPLYYVILHIWINLFGKSEIAIRSLSLVFYVGTVYVCFLILNEIFKFTTKKSTAYLLLIIINPILVYYAFEARMYTMLAFLASLSYYALYQKRWSLYIISLIAGLYTHYFMLFILISQFMYVTFCSREKILRQNAVKKMAISFLVFIPWFIYFLSQNKLAGSSFWIKPINMLTSLPGSLGALYVGHEVFYEYAVKYFQPVLIGLAIFTTIIVAAGLWEFRHNHRTEKNVMWYLVSWALLPPVIVGIISLFKPIILARYLIFSSIGFTLLLIFFLDHIKRLWRYILLAGLVIFTLQYQKLQVKYRTKSDYSHVFGEIKNIASKNDVVYVTSDLDFFTAEYYIDENRVYIYNKPYDQIPSYVGRVLIPKSKMVYLPPHYPQKAFIVAPDLSYTIQALY